MSEIEDLKKKLIELKEKKKEELEIKKLKSQIRGEEFSQTTGGKIFNKIGDFGLSMGKTLVNVGNKITTPPKQTNSKTKRKTLDEVMKSLPQ